MLMHRCVLFVVGLTCTCVYEFCRYACCVIRGTKYHAGDGMLFQFEGQSRIKVALFKFAFLIQTTDGSRYAATLQTN